MYFIVNRLHAYIDMEVDMDVPKAPIFYIQPEEKKNRDFILY